MKVNDFAPEFTSSKQKNGGTKVMKWLRNVQETKRKSEHKDTSIPLEILKYKNKNNHKIDLSHYLKQ